MACFRVWKASVQAAFHTKEVSFLIKETSGLVILEKSCMNSPVEIGKTHKTLNFLQD